MKPYRCLLALAPCVLAVAAHAAPATSTPYPAVLPGSKTDVAVHGPVSCSVLRVTPAADSTGNFNNPLVSVAYTAAQAKSCAAVTLTDAAGNAIATTIRYQHEWPHPSGGVVGVVALAPVDALQTMTTYQVRQAATPVGSFTTGASARGSVVVASDQPVNFYDLPKAAHISSSDINGMLGSILNDLVHNRIVAKLAEAVVRKEAPNLAKPRARYAARVKKLTYTSSRADGTPIVLSGLLVYPENADGSPIDYNGMPTVIGQHGSTRSKNPAPSSAATLEVVVGLLAAGKGHVYFAPDLIGLGDTANQTQAYLIDQDTSSASEDMLLAVRSYFANEFGGARLSPDLRIFGVSQGGYSAMSVLPAMSALADVKAVYAGEGPYDLFHTLQSPLLTLAGAPRDAYARYEDLGFVPGHLRTIMGGMRVYEGLAYNDSDIFTADGSLQPSFLTGFSQNQYPRLLAHMGLNTLLGGDRVYNAPQAKVVLFHYSKDSLVPAQNTRDMLAFLNNGRHTLGSVGRGNCYENSLFVKLVLAFSKSKEKTHTVCALYNTDQFIGEL